MKKTILYLAAGLLALVSCNKEGRPGSVKDPFTVSSPAPTERITKVSLSDTQKGYVEAGNAMAFRFLKEIYEGQNMVCSPLSLQYALAMTANGASGETLQEIIDFLGYGSEGIDALNEYSRILLEQLPAVNLDVTLKVTDALLVNKEYPLLPSFQKTVEDYYYAAVENADFSNPGLLASRINEWASRNTNGFIDQLIDAGEISPEAVAFIMNALYFKANWNGDAYRKMFSKEATIQDQFTLADGTVKMVDMMQNERYTPYAEMDGFRVVAIPYKGGKFFMYILLPDNNDVEGLLDKLQDVSWSSILKSLKEDSLIHLKLPKFDIENKYDLNKALMDLGVKRAFQRGSAQFDNMFTASASGFYCWIERVIQKARISVDENGTEAAAITVVQMAGESASGGWEPPQPVPFFADHPFVFAIGESTSGTILFEGVYSGK